MPVNHGSIAAREHRDLEAKFPDATAHPINRGVVLPGVSGVEDKALDGPCQYLRELSRFLLRKHSLLSFWLRVLRRLRPWRRPSELNLYFEIISNSLSVVNRVISSPNLGQVFHPLGEILDAIQFDVLNGDLAIPGLPIHQVLYCVLDTQT